LPDHATATKDAHIATGDAGRALKTMLTVQRPLPDAFTLASFMKKCVYCGKVYPDDAVQCDIDGNQLEEIKHTKLNGDATKPNGREMKRKKTIASLCVGIFFMVAGHLIFGEGEAPRHQPSEAFLPLMIIILVIGFALFMITKDNN